MSFSLPKASFNIFNVPITCLHIDLIERGMDILGPYISICFPEGLDSRMEIFAYSVRASIPKSNSFNEFVAESIVWEREGSIEETDQVGKMNGTVRDVVSPSDHWDIKIISCEHLSRLVDCL